MNSVSIVLIKQALDVCLRINRIININNSHGLLIGEGGSGRRSLTKIAAYMSDFNVYQIEIPKKFNKNIF